MTDDELIPGRIINEHVYCPRLAYLMWRDRAFADNAATVEGAMLHERVDRSRPERGRLAAPADGELTALQLTSEALGITAKLDSVRIEGDVAIPVETKRGRPYRPDEPVREPEQVQLAAAALLLRERGYRVPHAEVVFPQHRSRQELPITDALVERVLRVIAEIRANQATDQAPPRLIDSPKCAHCILLGLCLPDEVEHLRSAANGRVRRLIARDDPARPLYLTEHRARLVKRGGRLECQLEGETTASARLIDVSHVLVTGGATITSPALRACFDADIPVLWLSSGGRLAGVAAGQGPAGVRLRIRQHRASAIGAGAIAARIVEGKIRNQRTLIRRHRKHEARDVLTSLAMLARRAAGERSNDELLGLEGAAARLYFAEFGQMLRGCATRWPFDFTTRNRRPPKDPVNALLSFVYSLLLKDAVVAATSIGFDPHVGLFHATGYGRPAFALDLIEEFRPIVGDSTVLRMINNGEIAASDFVQRLDAVALTDAGRRRVIAAYERRMLEALRHPLFGYKTTYRRALEIQARILAAVLHGELPHYRPLTTR